MNSVLLRKGKSAHTQTHTENNAWMKEAEIRVMHRQAKECQGLAATTRSLEKGTEETSEPPTLVTSGFQISGLLN